MVHGVASDGPAQGPHAEPVAVRGAHAQQGLTLNPLYNSMVALRTASCSARIRRRPLSLFAVASA